MSRRLSTELRFISDLDEHAGHSRVASVTQLQSRQSTAWTSGMMDVFVNVVMVVFLPFLPASEKATMRFPED
jgi:hypothetical protein